LTTGDQVRDGPIESIEEAETGSRLDVLDGLLSHNGLYIALLAAWIATLGSLYFSEVRHYIPCRLCWFQRILMYPLAILIPVGLLRRDGQLALYILPLAVPGILVATYHYLLQKTDLFEESAACLVTVPCSVDYINWFGFVTIPFLALTAFLIITFASSATLKVSGELFARDQGPPWKLVAGIVGAVALAFAVLAKTVG
jgi:disulfide bond formation protein DsbB